MTIIACVRTGERYGMEYVTKLRNMVSRCFPQKHRMVCLTDQPDRCSDVDFVDVTALDLKGWWAKMALFAPEWRGQEKVIYLDLDTVLINEITPLAGVPGEFSICENFTRLHGRTSYPCKYNSSVMVIGGGKCSFVWDRFDRDRHRLLSKHERYGDQAAIEELYPDAPFLQRFVPEGFFVNYRLLTMIKPRLPAAVINFGGSNKPENCSIPWVRESWL